MHLNSNQFLKVRLYEKDNEVQSIDFVLETYLKCHVLKISYFLDILAIPKQKSIQALVIEMIGIYLVEKSSHAYERIA